MNSPLRSIQHKLPINIIQSYLKAEIALEAVYNHIHYLNFRYIFKLYKFTYKLIVKHSNWLSIYK